VIEKELAQLGMGRTRKKRKDEEIKITVSEKYMPKRA